MDDRSVLLSLQEVTEAINADRVVADEQEAAELLGALFSSAGGPGGPVAPADPVAAGRRLLDHVLRDEDTAGIAREVLADPPTDDQMSVEVAASTAVVLGALVGWLQTKVDIKVSRKDGKTEFSFHVVKNAASPGLLKRLADVVAGIIGGPPQP
ncbi:hypothetical protein A6A25_33920 [Saccharothrix sp. CB00851]|nr:hypothetical protein A6A25_33920 [Saccharothrix sp. CB00851]